MYELVRRLRRPQSEEYACPRTTSRGDRGARRDSPIFVLCALGALGVRSSVTSECCPIVSWLRDSEGAPRDPLAQQRVDDEVAVPLARQDIVSHQRCERSLHGGRAGETMACAHVSSEQLSSFFEHCRAEGAALRYREPLPHRLEDRVVLVQQATQRRVEQIEI